MRTSTKIWLAIFVISNIGMLYLFDSLLDILKFSEGTAYLEFTPQAYIALILFVFANISGAVVIGRFILTQPLSRQIFFSIVPPTITFALLTIFFFTITTTEQTQLVLAVRAIFGITTESARYIWVGVIGGIYLIYILIICILIAKPMKKVERAVEILKYGKSRKAIKIGGSKQFQNIEQDLNVINENYKESDKIIKKIDPIIIKEAVEETKPKEKETIPNLVIPSEKC